MIDTCLKFANAAEWEAAKPLLPADAVIDDIGIIRELIFDNGVAVGSAAVAGYHVNVRSGAAIDEIFTAYEIVPANPVREFAK